MSSRQKFSVDLACGLWAPYQHQVVIERYHWQTEARLSELGIAGHVRPQTYLDWMQDAAGVACSAAGFPVSKLRDLGIVWFVRDMELYILNPAGHQDPIEVETWVSDLRRFRTHREYRIRSGDRLIAKAQTDWLYMGQGKNGKIRPKRPPEAMEDAFPRLGEYALEGEQKQQYPKPEGEPHSVSQRVVHHHALDENQHLNNAIYLQYIEDQAAVLSLGNLKYVRMEYLLDASALDRLELKQWQHSESNYWELWRGEQKLFRAITIHE